MRSHPSFTVVVAVIHPGVLWVRQISVIVALSSLLKAIERAIPFSFEGWSLALFFLT